MMEQLSKGLLVVVLCAALWLRTSAQTRPEQLFRDHLWQPHGPVAWNHLPVTTKLTPVYSISPAAPVYDEKTADSIASRVLRLALNVGHQLNEVSPTSKSEVFSPVSLFSALSLLLLGARGRSYLELEQLLGLNLDPGLIASRFHQQFGFLLQDVQSNDTTSPASPLFTRRRTPWRDTEALNNIRSMPGGAEFLRPFEQIVRVANGLFVQANYNINPDYRLVVASVYRTEVALLDFQNESARSCEYINRWVSHNTFDKIQNIIGNDVPSSTKIIIASALYFKGFWENTFFETATVLDVFYPNGPKQPPVKVKMMATGGVFPYYESPELNCRIIGLPYKGNMTTMYVIKPNQSTRWKLKELQASLDANKIDALISKMSQKSAVLAFPKMHVQRSVNLKSILNRLGVNDIFQSGYSDLSLMSEGLGLVPGGKPQTADHVPNPTGFESPAQAVNHAKDCSTNINGRISPSSVHGSSPLECLEQQRHSAAYAKSDIFVEDIVHKVDFDVNEHGTEAAAATLTYLRRSGTDVLFRADEPFLVLIRHDPTKLVLFYAIINEPEL